MVQHAAGWLPALWHHYGLGLDSELLKPGRLVCGQVLAVSEARTKKLVCSLPTLLAGGLATITDTSVNYRREATASPGLFSVRHHQRVKQRGQSCVASCANNDDTD